MINRIKKVLPMTDDQIPITNYRRHLRRAKAVHNYFMFFRAFTKIMSKLEAMFLQDLINREEMVVQAQATRDKTKSGRRKHRMVDEDDYFRCTTAFMENEKYLVWTGKEQKRLFKLLVNRGFIKTKNKGMPQRRWVWVNYPLIESSLDEAAK